MLSRHDAEVVARDPALSGLGLLLDPDGFAAWLDEAAPDHAVRAVEPLYLRYKPGSSCVAGFRATTADGPVDLYAKAYTEAHFGIVANRAEHGARFTALAHPRLMSPDHRMVVRHAAADRELPAVRQLAVPHRQAKFLGALLSQPTPGMALETLRYKAERRFVGRVSRDRAPVALVKAYTKGDYPDALARARRADAAGLARMLGADERRRAVALAWLEGTPLDGLERPAFEMAVRRAGSALAALHSGQPLTLFERDRGREVSAALKAVAAVAVLSSALGEQAFALVRRAAGAFRGAARPAVTIHGDFSADQVLATRSGATILDWDALSNGEAGIDIGGFIARLEADAAIDDAAPASTENAVSALLRGYQDRCGRLPEAIDLYAVLGMVRLAPEPFRNRQADWPDCIAAILARAEAILERSAWTTRRNRRTG